MKKLRLDIPKTKAELPALIVMFLIVFFGWGAHNHIFGYLGGAVWAVITVPILLVVYNKRKGDYFVEADENGIGWRQHFFSRYNYIPWNYLQRIDYLEYEINFMLKETAQVVSFALSGLSDEQADQLKDYISDAIKNHIENDKNMK